MEVCAVRTTTYFHIAKNQTTCHHCKPFIWYIYIYIYVYAAERKTKKITWKMGFGGQKDITRSSKKRGSVEDEKWVVELR